jgi:hypothetical protein
MREITEKSFMWDKNWKGLTFTAIVTYGIYAWVTADQQTMDKKAGFDPEKRNFL